MISRLREELIKYPQNVAHHELRIPHLHAMAPPEEALDKCTELTRLLQCRADGWNEALTLLELCERIEGLDPTQCDGHGVSPLNAAILHDQGLPVLEKLIEGGADVDAPDENGVFPLEIALVRGEMDVITLLGKNRVDGARRFDHNRTYAHLAVRRGVAVKGLKKVKTDVNAADDYGWSPLHYAAFRTPSEMQALLRSRPQLDEVTPDGDTALSLAAKRALSLRIRHWSSEGSVGDAPASYTIEDGVMTFRMKGRVRKISPRDERIMAVRLGKREHAQYMNALEVAVMLAKKATLSLQSADGTPILQLLADLQRPELKREIGKRGAKLPAPRSYREVATPAKP